MQPLVPGFAIAGELCSCAAGSMWAAVRAIDDEPLALRIIAVPDLAKAQAQAAEMVTLLDGVANQHLVRQHASVALADGRLALVFDQVIGASLDQLLGDRGHLTAGETVTTVAPLFGALADLHAAGVVHGDLAARTVFFSADGRPMITELGVSRLLGPPAGPAEPTDRARCFAAPEVVNGAGHSPASDVFSMAALGWFCLVGAPPGPSSARPSLSALSPGTPARLVDVLTSCLSADPSARPSARKAAIEVFDAAPAESVVLISAADPATEITRRIRATAASAPVLASPPSNIGRLRRYLGLGAVALLVAFATVAGTSWFPGRSQVAVHAAGVRPVAVHTAAVHTAAVHPALAHPVSAQPKAVPSTSNGPAATGTPSSGAPKAAPLGVTDVVTARESPRIAAAALLQALVDARALAYAARNPVLLDLVYSPGAAKAGADRANLATALENGATYIGLAFVVKDAAFLSGTSTTARIRATIVTPAYQTGQPDGRKVPHPKGTVGPSVFTLSLTRDGWRILALTAR